MAVCRPATHSIPWLVPKLKSFITPKNFSSQTFNNCDSPEKLLNDCLKYGFIKKSFYSPSLKKWGYTGFCPSVVAVIP